MMCSVSCDAQRETEPLSDDSDANEDTSEVFQNLVMKVRMETSICTLCETRF